MLSVLYLGVTPCMGNRIYSDLYLYIYALNPETVVFSYCGRLPYFLCSPNFQVHVCVFYNRSDTTHAKNII